MSPGRASAACWCSCCRRRWPYGGCVVVPRLGVLPGPDQDHRTAGEHAARAPSRPVRDSSSRRRSSRSSLLAVGTINFFDLVFRPCTCSTYQAAAHPAGGAGLVLGAAAIGGVVGAAVTRRICAVIGVGWAYTLGCALFAAPVALVPLASGPRPLVLGMLFAAEFGSGFGVMVLDISIGSIFAAVIPAGVAGAGIRGVHGGQLRHPPGRCSARRGARRGHRAAPDAVDHRGRRNVCRTAAAAWPDTALPDAGNDQPGTAAGRLTPRPPGRTVPRG